MRGSVVKKNNNWYVIIEQRDPQTGKRIRKWHSGFRTKREAESARTDILSRTQRGIYVESSTQTLGTFLTEEWIPSKAATVRPSTLQSYEQMIRTYVVPRLGSSRLQDVKAPALNTFYATLLSSGRLNGSGGLSPKTVRNVHVVIRKAMSDAVRWGRLATNPADSADPPRPRSTEMHSFTVWTAEELQRFLNYVRSIQHPLSAVFLTAATTGMRRGEVLGLRWSDVDMNAGHLSIRRALIAIANRIQFAPPKTQRSQRLVTLDPRTISVLREHKTRQATIRLQAGPIWEDNDLVFSRDDGTPLHPDWVSKTFKRLVGEVDVPTIRFHDLRHTHATLALTAGVHPKVVSERLGHANISITLDTYSHVLPSLQSEVAETVARLVFGQ